jgi:putative MFS transporter
MTLAAAWGEGLDGYDLGVLSVVLPLITVELGMSAIWAGLIGASSLLGIFVGSPIAGYLTDRFGRRRMFTLDIVAFVLLGVLQGLVTRPWQLFVVRLLLGVAIGAEYAIGAAMLAEFAPSRGAAGDSPSCWCSGTAATWSPSSPATRWWTSPE